LIQLERLKTREMSIKFSGQNEKDLRVKMLYAVDTRKSFKKIGFIKTNGSWR